MGDDSTLNIEHRFNVVPDRVRPTERRGPTYRDLIGIDTIASKLSPASARRYNQLSVNIRNSLKIPTRLPASLAALGLLLLSATTTASDWSPGRLLAFTDETCQAWELVAAPAAGYASAEIGSSDLRFGEAIVGRRYRVPIENKALVELDVVERVGL
jgi:hypothetical protein